RLKVKQVQNWLDSQTVYQLHRPARKIFPRRRVRVRNVDQEWMLDLAFLKNIQKANSGYRYLLFAIDILSRYLWLEPMKTKSGPSAAAAFKNILARSRPRQPKTVFMDKGSEFIAAPFKAVLNQHDIKQYFATDPKTKASVVERSIKSVMG